MLLPFRTTLDDVDAVCGYLVTKPTGATRAEAKAVIDSRCLDRRKLTALKFWGLIEDDGNKMKVTDRGRRAVRDSGSGRSKVLLEVVRQVPPYVAVIERVAHRREETITATEVAAHWYEHFKNDVSTSDRVLNDQAVCFFHVAQGADLGTLTMGRRGNPTRLAFDAQAIRTFVDPSTVDTEHGLPTDDSTEVDDLNEPTETGGTSGEEGEADDTAKTQQPGLYHTRKEPRDSGPGKGHHSLREVRTRYSNGTRNSCQACSLKVMGDMRTCRAAVIHVSTEGVLRDGEGNEVPRINENVLIEIGAAMALYGDKFVLLVEEGVDLPSNLQGLYECRYKGDELTGSAVMKLLKVCSDFETSWFVRLPIQ